MTELKSCGVLYVATQEERYIQEAIASATSLKRFCPDLPVCLFTDLTESPLVKSDCFDSIRPVAIDTECGSRWGRGLRTRMLSLPQSPFERTFHLDSDTRFMSGDVQNLFSILDEFDIGIVEDSADVSVSVRNYGLRLFNAGVMLYRKSDAVDELFKQWQQLFLVQLEAAAQDPLPRIDYMESIRDPIIRRKMLANDQFALGQLMNPESSTLDVKVKVLDETWNFSGTFVGRSLDRPIHVDHGPHLKVDAFSRTVHRAKPKSLNEMMRHLIGSIAKAHSEFENGDDRVGRQTLQNAVSAMPNQSLIQLPLAREAAKLGNYSKACTHAQSAIQSVPTCSQAFIELASAQFNDGDIEAAASTIARFQSRFPQDQGIFGMAAIVAAEQGTLEHSIANPDYESLLRQTHFDLEPSLKQSLVDFVSHQRLLETERPEGTPENFYRTSTLTRMAGPQIDHFQQLLRPKVEQYIEFLKETQNPLLQYRPSKLSIACWGTATGKGGYMRSHVHKNAWLSGVVYLQVPTTDLSDTVESGGSEFGRPPIDEYHYSNVPDTRVLEPVEGLLLLHPSHYWHGTLPNPSDQLQVSIGFNVLEFGEV
jgi:hypothetical protein